MPTEPRRDPCCVPGCDDLGYNRGLCDKHYQTAHQLIKAGKTSWAHLQSKGKCKPLRLVEKQQVIEWFLDDNSTERA